MKIGVLASAALALMLFSAPASAENTIFGYSCCTPWTITINGSQAFNSIDTGWIKSTGEHISYLDNYIAGEAGEGTAAGIVNWNNWAVFNFSSLAGSVETATLTVFTSTVTGGPMNFTLHDTVATLDELDKFRFDGDSAGVALFNDLGSGNTYGSRTYFGSDSNTYQSITLNTAAIEAIKSAGTSNFALGGTATLATVPSTPSAVPEPASWALMITGFGLAGQALRKQSGRFSKRTEKGLRRRRLAVALR